MRVLPVRATWLVLSVASWVLTGCAGGARDTQAGPFGWSGPIEAREVKQWSAQSLEEAPRWEMTEPPAFVVVPDSVLTPDGKGAQRYVAGAVATVDEKVVLLTAPAGPDSILLHIVDVVTGEETRVPAPAGVDGESLVWADLTMSAHGRGVLLLGSTRSEYRVSRRDRTEGVWFATSDGEFWRPASHVDLVGPLQGVLSDGSLVVRSSGWTRTTDTTVIASTLLVKPMPADQPLPRSHSPELVFETARVRDPDADYPVSFHWAHDPYRATGVADDIIWTVPTERPEIVGLDRSGQVLLRVEWDAGDRSIPTDASDEVRKGLRGLTRFPAARRLVVGTHGLLHVQRVAWRDGQPQIGPEWLVFTPTGDLVASVDIPRNLEVMAFGPGSVIAKARDEDGVLEIRVYALRKSAGGSAADS